MCKVIPYFGNLCLRQRMILHQFYLRNRNKFFRLSCIPSQHKLWKEWNDRSAFHLSVPVLPARHTQIHPKGGLHKLFQNIHSENCIPRLFQCPFQLVKLSQRDSVLPAGCSVHRPARQPLYQSGERSLCQSRKDHGLPAVCLFRILPLPGSVLSRLFLLQQYLFRRKIRRCQAGESFRCLKGISCIPRKHLPSQAVS